jgi:hypothetical protein
MPEGNNDSNIFPKNARYEDSLFPTRPKPGGAIFPNHREFRGNLFPVAELTQEEVAKIEKFADKKGLSPVNKIRLINHCRDVAATHKKPQKKYKDSLW